MLDPRHVLDLPFAGEMGPLLILSVILLAGVLGGRLARLLHVPTVTGNMLAGILLGPVCLDLFSGIDVATELKPLSTFAMGVVTVSVGSHLSYRRIHNALRRIITIAAFEVLGAVVLVTLVVRLLGADWPVAFMLGSIAASTAPASNIALVREMRAKGTFVKTFLSVVALDNMLCMMLFAFSVTLMVGAYRTGASDSGVSWALVHMGWQFGGSFCLAMVLGVLVERSIHRPKTHDFSLVFVAILLSVGISQYFELSPLLTSLFFGVYLGNSSEEAARQTRSLEPIEPLLFICFFTVAGASLHLGSLVEAGLLCAAYVIARFTGKAAGRLRGRVAVRILPPHLVQRVPRPRAASRRRDRPRGVAPRQSQHPRRHVGTHRHRGPRRCDHQRTHRPALHPAGPAPLGRGEQRSPPPDRVPARGIHHDGP